ncbi:hypothetical protein JXC34_02070 [Candidatus Woesearchaeota archaeon]|nr:hypothetical protein [Candidatus Woesearchaeota archaeon]
MTKLKDIYADYRKRYNLPEFKELNEAFYIEDIDSETELLLPRIREKTAEKFEEFAKLIENMLQPDNNLADMYEAHYISDKERNDAYSVFKRLMHWIRKSGIVALDNSEKENAEFINGAYNEWSELRTSIKKHVERLSSLWKKETDMKNDMSYFG